METAATGVTPSTSRTSSRPLSWGSCGGPSHLANAVKTPGVILLGRFGTWDYYMPCTGFYADSRNCRILRHAGAVSDLPLGLCLNVVDEVLPVLLDTTEDPQHA